MNRYTPNRNRRIICHDDGAKVKHICRIDVRELFRKRVEHLIQPGSQVDTYFYCGHDNFTMAFYRSNVPGVELSYARHSNDPDCDPNVALPQVLAHYDPSEKLIELMHRELREVFWDFLMNDVQDHPFDRVTTPESRRSSLSQYKKDHPELLLGSADVDYPYQSVQNSIWSALNYAKPEVIALAYACIEEVANRYDVDGLNFNYGRNASLFPPTFEQRAVEGRHLDILTSFHRRLRELANNIGSQRGYPLLLSAVVPETLSLCKYVGIDLEVWLAKGLIDIIIAGNGYVPFTQHVQEIIDLGHRYNVPVYPHLNCMADERIFVTSKDALYAVSSNFFQLGGDGIFLFNYFGEANNPRVLDDVLNEIGEPEQIRWNNKLFRADTNRQAWINGADVSYYMPLDGTVPLALSRTGGAAKFYLGNVSSLPNYFLCIRIDGWERNSPPNFVFNGRRLEGGVVDTTCEDKYNRLEDFESPLQPHKWFTYRLNSTQLRPGINILEDCEDRLVNEDGPRSLVAARLARVYLEEVWRSAASG